VSAQSPGLATFEHSIRRYATDPSWTLRANTDDDYAALTEWARDDDDVTLVREYQHTKGDGGTVTIGRRSRRSRVGTSTTALRTSRG